MLTPAHRLAIYVPEQLIETRGKMAHGVLRYSPHQVICAIDPTQAGRTTGQLLHRLRHDVPVVAGIDEAAALGANVLVLGVAPLGGRLPEAWLPELRRAVGLGMSIVNGLHDHLDGRLGALQPGQFLWDIRREPQGLGSATGEAGKLANQRLLMVGSDMSVGKMTAGLELWRAARQRGIDAAFVATGQIGITICGSGVPLDAVRIDYAAGSVQAEVLSHRDAELIIVEGQGSLFHPSSSATLPLIRGTCPTHLLYCHRAGQTHLRDFPQVQLPPLTEATRLYEEVAAARGAYPRPRTIGIVLNGERMDDATLAAYASDLSRETGLPVADALRHSLDPILDNLLQPA